MASTSFKQELKALLVLGWPIVLTQLFIMLTGLIDAAMAGRYSSVDLAGVSMGGMLLWPNFMLLTGITMALTPIIAQLRGARRDGDVAHQIRQGMWLCLGTSTLLVIILRNIGALYPWIGADPQASFIAAEYLSAVSWGIPPIIFYVALRHIFEGLGTPRPPMYIAGFIIPINALLNYAFIYGKFGAPELGGIGCGYATAISFWIQLSIMLLVCRTHSFKSINAFAQFDAPQWSAIRSMLIIGVPIGLTIFVELAVFSVVGLLIARIGVVEVAANSIAGNLNWATYVIPSALGSAASIRVGFHVGAHDLRAARTTATTVYQFSIAYALVIAALLFSLRFALIGIFTTDAQVIELTATLVIFIAVYQLVDDANAVSIGALRGYKDTQLPMWMSLVGYWFIAVPFGYLLAEEIIWPGVAPGVYGYWSALTLGLTLVAVCTGLRLWRIVRNDQKILRLAAT